MLTTTQVKPKLKMENKGKRLPDIPAFPANESREVSPVVKIAITGAFLLSLIAFITAALLSRTLAAEKQARAHAEASRIQLEDQIDVLQQESGKTESQFSRLRAQIKTYSTENSKLARDLDQTSLELSNTRKQIRSLEQQNARLTDANERLQTEADRAVAAPIAVAETLTIESDEALLPFAEEAAEIVGKTQPGIIREDAGVMTVNRKFNFVVINVGLEDNLKMGDRLRVVRDGKDIANVQVEKLYDRLPREFTNLRQLLRSGLWRYPDQWQLAPERYLENDK